MENIFIFVADALRYDFLPNSIKSEGKVLKTLAPSLHTPTSFSSLITGRNPTNHNVRSFFDTLDPHIDTLFDKFEEGSYYDHPQDPMSKTVLKHCPKPRELAELSPPFIYIERAMETHVPYGKISHGNDVNVLKRRGVPLGQEYVNKLKRGEISTYEYIKGVKKVEKHFWGHIRELQEQNLLDDTLVIFTSDHGELLGEKILLKRWYTHSLPMCKELVLVPTVFFGFNFDVDFIRTIDIASTALNILEKKSLDHSDGYNVKEKKPTEGITVMEGSKKEKFPYTYEIEWEFKRGNLIPKNKYKLFSQNLNAMLLNQLSAIPNKKIAEHLKSLQFRIHQYINKRIL